MVSPCGRITIKFLELIGCISCVITKLLTDLESRRIMTLNRKISREWSLSHNITWSKEGNAYANITYGGYTIIIGLMLISRCIDSKSRPNVMEKTFLVLGMLMFFAAGGLVFASIDQVPYGLIDNAIILGCLSFAVAFLMLIDLSDPLARLRSHLTQTDNGSLSANDNSTHSVMKISNNVEPNSPLDAITPAPSNIQQVSVDVVETGVLPRAETPILSRIKPCPEKSYKIQGPRQSQDLSQHIDRMHSDFSTYVRAPTVDQENSQWTLRKPVVRNISQKRYKEFSVDNNDTNTPIRPGYVANVAKMWDSKMRKSKAADITGLNTSV